MSNIIKSLEDAVELTPETQLVLEEQEKQIVKFCTFCAITSNKKINLTAIFNILMSRPKYRQLFTEMNSCQSERDAIGLFIKHFPTVARSKLIHRKIKK